ncbi:MAG: hypothetical protein WDW36_009365 [Sanguina aurantia]
MASLKAWSGRYQQDSLHGHRAAVRCIQLLPQHNLLATGSLDRTVRLWDLQAGMPSSVSRPLGGTVRCLAMDSALLVSGCTDHSLRLWTSHAHTTEEPEQRPPPAHDDVSPRRSCGGVGRYGDSSPAHRQRAGTDSRGTRSGGQAPLFDVASPGTVSGERVFPVHTHSRSLHHRV